MNSSDNRPPRLADDPVYGKAWRAARSSPLSKERLARNATAVASKIEAGAKVASSVAAGTVAKVVIPIVVSAAAGGYLVLSHSSDQQTINPEPARAPAVATVEDAPAVETREPTSLQEPRGKKKKRRARARYRRPPTGVLAEELEMSETARATADNGDPILAIEQLDELLEKYPSTRLGAEIAFGRADYLARAGRNEDAIRAIQHLLLDTAHEGRKGELLHMLGDLWVKEGHCDRATRAYDGALEAGVSDNDAELIRRGLDECGRE